MTVREEGLQQLPFLLNTRRCRHLFSGKRFGPVSVYLWLQGRQRKEARKKGWSRSFFSAVALTEVVHRPITVTTSQRQKCQSPVFQAEFAAQAYRKSRSSWVVFQRLYSSHSLMGRRGSWGMGEKIFFFFFFSGFSKRQKKNGRGQVSLSFDIVWQRHKLLPVLGIWWYITVIKTWNERFCSGSQIRLWLVLHFYFHLPFAIHYGVLLGVTGIYRTWSERSLFSHWVWFASLGCMKT